jgi:hypothetical protein
MATIIAGEFDTFDEANAASDVLRDKEFPLESIAVFFNNAPGAHGAFPVGGDEDSDPGARNADVGAAAGAAAGAVAGLAAAVVAPPVAVAVVASTAAYVGSLAGGIGGSHEAATSAEPARRPAGVMVAVALAGNAREEIVIEALRHRGARNIERAEGDIRDGRWTDFNPISRPHLVTEAATLDNYPGD